MKHSKSSLTHFVWTDALLKRSIEDKKILLHAEHQSSTYDCPLPLWLGLMLLGAVVQINHIAGSFMEVKSGQIWSNRIQTCQQKRILAAAGTIDGGRGETVFFTRNDLPQAGTP